MNFPSFVTPHVFDHFPTLWMNYAPNKKRYFEVLTSGTTDEVTLSRNGVVAGVMGEDEVGLEQG